MQSSNKRIARNTLMLYIRTFVMMPVSLYTSRIILEVLGENDFGVYNVVGGFIALLSFINSAMTKATQRFLNVELGKGNHDRVSRVYSMSLLIHFAICIIRQLLFIVITSFYILTCSTPFWIQRCTSPNFMLYVLYFLFHHFISIHYITYQSW